ncbi:hypothetical protein GOODEAATRI_007784 [Goodea atripinnis]|uniref:Uncharacterized protein n=1 Tax=Goodea atripinnis TaxID=208336 RepID=A0ABV0NUA0_9TELE
MQSITPLALGLPWESISPDPGGYGGLVLPQERVELRQADVEGLAKVEERPVPAAVSTQLRGPLYGREDSGAAQQVYQDEEGEQDEAAVVLVQVQGAAALQSLAGHHPNFSTTLASDSDKLHIECGIHGSAGTLWKSQFCPSAALGCNISSTYFAHHIVVLLRSDNLHSTCGYKRDDPQTFHKKSSRRIVS